MDDFTIHVVCPNPALDRLQTVREFTPFEVNRVTSVRNLAGGKGMIVCRASRRMGARVTAHGFVGGAVGQIIRRGCDELGVDDHHVEIAGDTRVTPVIIEESTGRSTVLNERGPDVTSAEQDALLAGLDTVVRPGDVVVSTGSLPPGCAVNLHAEVARRAAALGALAMIDAHGEALGALIEDLQRTPATGRLIVKPNAAELGEVLGLDLSSIAAATGAVRDLRLQTGATFVLTLGVAGAIWSGDTIVTVDSPQVDTVNATGSGDSFLAGLAVALGRGDEPSQAMALAAAMGAANAANLIPDVDPDVVAALMPRVNVTAGNEFV
jgi:1-phosphofructokinase family hexose kinase